MVMFAASVYAQPIEDVPSSQDSLQTTEEVPIPVENVSADTLVNDPSSVLQEFLQALKTGDSFMISQLISEDGLDEIDIMLDILKESIEDNEESTMSRLSAAGYTATADEIDDWSSIDYLKNTIVLPVMKARYSLYDMQIGEYSINGDELVIPLIFSTASGVQLPYEANLVKDDDQWKVTNFMGLNSFP
jgi:hypothetical protein